MRSTLGLNKVLCLQCLKIFIVVIVFISLATGLRLLDIDNTELIWLTFYPVVIISALCAGVYAGLLATLGACLTVLLLWPLLLKHTVVENNTDIIVLALFVLVCGFISYLAGALNRYKAALERVRQEFNIISKREQFISSIINYMPNMIGYWDRDLRCRFANKAYTEWFHKKPEQIVGMTFRELTGERLFALNEPYIRAVLAGQSQRFERTLQKTDGTAGSILGQYIPDFDVDGTVKGFAIQSSEITDLKETEAQLKMAAYVFDTTMDAVMINDVDGLILSVNPAFSEITGYSSVEVDGQSPELLKTDWHARVFYISMWQELTSRERWRGEVWCRRKDGGLFLARVATNIVRDNHGEVIRYVSVFSDITDLWRKDEYLKHLAFYDALTDLPNRSLMVERLDQKIIHSKREPYQLALMFIDLDGFKQVNDQYGHSIGDELLKVVAARLLVLVRESDTVARLGGDEFIFILDKPTVKTEVEVVANRILSSINDPIELHGHLVEIAMSIGIAMYPADGISSAELIKNADAAMYTAKASGNNNICFFST